MNTMSYQGYTARIEFDERDSIFVGRVLGLRSIISFHGQTVEELRGQFAAAVDDTAARLAEGSPRPSHAQGVALTRVEREETADSLRYAHVSVSIDRTRRTATLTLKAPTGPQPTDIADIEAAGAAWWPLGVCAAEPGNS